MSDKNKGIQFKVIFDVRVLTSNFQIKSRHSSAKFWTLTIDPQYVNGISTAYPRQKRLYWLH